MTSDPNTWPVAAGDRPVLVTWSRSTSVRAGQALRARIVLAAAEGDGTGQIAERLGVTRPTVIKWRSRYAALGLAGLDDRPRPGHPRIVAHAAVLVATLAPPPPGAARWSTRLLAEELGVGDATVARAWRRYGIQPVGRATLSFATAPALEAAALEVLGVYLDGPDRAIVVRVRPTVPPAGLSRPLRTGSWAPANSRRDHEASHGSRRLVAAMARAAAREGVADSPHAEGLLGFLARIVRSEPPEDLHVVLDAARTGEPPEVRNWIEAHGWGEPHVPTGSRGWPALASALLALTYGDSDAQGVTEAVAVLESLVTVADREHRSFIWLAR